MKRLIPKSLRAKLRRTALRALRRLLKPGSRMLRDLLLSRNGVRLTTLLLKDDPKRVADALLQIDFGLLNSTLTLLLLADERKRLKTLLSKLPQDQLEASLVELLVYHEGKLLRGMILDNPHEKLQALLQSAHLEQSGRRIHHYLEGRTPKANAETLAPALLADDHAVLKQAIRLKPTQDLLSLWQEYFLSNQGKRLLTLLEQADAAQLNPVLREHLLRERGRHLADFLGEAEPQRMALALRDFLLHDDGVRLHALLQACDFRNLGPLLQEFLCADDARRLGTLLQLAPAHALTAALSKDDYKAFREVLLADSSAALRQALVADNAKILRTAFFVHGLMELLLEQPQAHGWFHFDLEWRAMQPWLEGAPAELRERVLRRRQAIKTETDYPARLTEALVQEGVLSLGRHRLHVGDAHALWILIHELFINEDYFTEIESDSPRILDCGAHQGLSLYYFKRRFPDARITAFEPDPSNRAIAQRNIEDNQLQGVEILPYAIAATEGVAHFNLPKGFSMAGSLTERRRAMGNEIETIEVTCVPLSRYLGEPVDFLKLDIEGSECEVLEEAAPYLRQVRYLFCEYHHGLGLAADRLTRILKVLDDAGFDTQVSKSYSYQVRTEHRPFPHVGEPYSASIFARRRDES